MLSAGIEALRSSQSSKPAFNNKFNKVIFDLTSARFFTVNVASPLLLIAEALATLSLEAFSPAAAVITNGLVIAR